jgi:leucyl aminopeptidase (aminopeptidase T)
VKITGQKPFVSDGIITDADQKEGYAGSNTYLPAGEIYVTPVPGTAQGKVVVDRFFFEGKEIKRLVLEFKDGKLKSMTAAIGLAPLKALYDAMTDAKDEFAFVDFGFNPDVVIPPGSSMDAWMVSGMATVGVGNNMWAGGDNKSRFSLSLHQLSCTVKLDGKILIDKGKLKL